MAFVDACGIDKNGGMIKLGYAPTILAPLNDKGYHLD